LYSASSSGADPEEVTSNECLEYYLRDLRDFDLYETSEIIVLTSISDVDTNKFLGLSSVRTIMIEKQLNSLGVLQAIYHQTWGGNEPEIAYSLGTCTMIEE